MPKPNKNYKNQVFPNDERTVSDYRSYQYNNKRQKNNYNYQNNNMKLTQYNTKQIKSKDFYTNNNNNNNIKNINNYNNKMLENRRNIDININASGSRNNSENKVNNEKNFIANNRKIKIFKYKPLYSKTQKSLILEKYNINNNYKNINNKQNSQQLNINNNNYQYKQKLNTYKSLFFKGNKNHKSMKIINLNKNTQSQKNLIQNRKINNNTTYNSILKSPTTNNRIINSNEIFSINNNNNNKINMNMNMNKYFHKKNYISKDFNLHKNPTFSNFENHENNKSFDIKKYIMSRRNIYHKNSPDIINKNKHNDYFVEIRSADIKRQLSHPNHITLNKINKKFLNNNNYFDDWHSLGL
jgi:hypothetical protein